MSSHINQSEIALIALVDEFQGIQSSQLIIRWHSIEEVKVIITEHAEKNHD